METEPLLKINDGGDETGVKWALLCAAGGLIYGYNVRYCALAAYDVYILT